MTLENKNVGQEWDKYQLSDKATVSYLEKFLDDKEQMKIYHHLLHDNHVTWTQGKYKTDGGSTVLLPRILSSMTSVPTVTESTSSATVSAVSNEYTGSDVCPWTLPILDLKKTIEDMLGIKIRYAQLNYYRDGKDHIGWHSDRELKPGEYIVSLSLGETSRVFQMQSKKDKYSGNESNIQSFTLKPGSLLIMNYESGNKEFLHRIVQDKKVEQGRINITFRQ